MNEDWLKRLDQYDVQFLVLNLHSERDMVKFYRSQSGWRINFEDGESIIFARTEATLTHNLPTQRHQDIPIAA